MVHPRLADSALGRQLRELCRPEAADWQTAYFGANLPRLKTVRSVYDPDNVFAFPQSIPPA